MQHRRFIRSLAAIAACALLSVILPSVAAAQMICDGLTATIIGTPGDDDLMGTPGDDVIYLGAGNDRVSAGPGNDVICGGDGRDTIHGNGGADRIFGEGGVDKINGNGGSDYLRGGPGADVINGYGAADDIDGGPGNDSISGQNGADLLVGGGGTDTIRGHTGPDRLEGFNGDDQMFGGDGNDVFLGGGGVDRCSGNTGANDRAQHATCEMTPGIENSLLDWFGDDSWVPPTAVVVFQDSFDDFSLDSAWSTCYWWTVDGGCTIASNNELQWYQPANVVESGSSVRLEAREQQITGTFGNDYDYTSGMIQTGPPDNDSPANFAFQYGGAEARIRIPAGAEFWPAFWMLPADRDSLPEIDVMEGHGDEPLLNSVRVHTFDPGGSYIRFNEEHDTLDQTAGWHTFGVIWNSQEVSFLYDGVITHTMPVNNPEGMQIPDEPMYLILNVAVDPEPHSPPTGSAAFPAALEVDWVQVWQLPENL